MSKVSDTSQNDDLMDVARGWYLKLADDPGDDLVLSRFEEWVSAEDAHRQAFNDVVDFWSHIDSMPEIQQLQQTGSEIPVENLQRSEDKSILEFIRKKPATKAPSTIWNWRQLAVAATVLIICSVVVNLYSNYLPEGSYRTAAGEQQVIQLADGSTIYLNTRSKFKVDFTDNMRKIHLLAGEARFDVAKDNDRPFIVETSWGDVRAVGTSFNIYDNDEMIEILVFEGTVAVDHKKNQRTEAIDLSLPSQTAVLVTDGERIVFFDKNIGVIRAANDFEMSQKNAWQSGKLIFRGQKLSEVIKEISRYTNKKIIIADDHLNEMKLGGVFDIDDFDALFNAIEDAFPIKVIRFTPFITVIVEA